MTLIRYSGFKVTSDPDYDFDGPPIPGELLDQFPALYKASQDRKNKHIVDKLEKLIKKYPQVPALKNYLTVAYSTKGLNAKAQEVNQKILREHPGYLFGKLNAAHLFLHNGEPEKVASVLGETLDLKALYPEREVFHTTEVAAFYNMAVRYFTKTGNLEKAESSLKVLKDLVPYSSATETAEEMVFELRLRQNLERLTARSRKEPLTPAAELPEQTVKAPRFHHPEMHDLYKYGLNIPAEKIEAVLALPRQTLIEDLNNVLEDGLKRYDFYEKKDWEEATHNFVLHALFLLTELKANESLPNILNFLSHGEEVLEYWLGEHRTETLWRCFYGFGEINLEPLKNFLLKPGVDLYVKGQVATALSQLVLHHPEKRNAILAIFTDVLGYFYTLEPDNDLLDPELNGFIIIEAIDAQLPELKPQIKLLYEKDYVAETVVGEYEDVEKEFSAPPKRKKQEIYTTAELYHHITTTWFGYQEDRARDPDDEPDYDLEKEIDSVIRKHSLLEHHDPLTRAEPKVGRNDPCFCGSGKKFKKCCGG